MAIQPTTAQADINAVLAQMRALRAQAQTGPLPVQGLSPIAEDSAQVKSPNRVDFGAEFKSAIDAVNSLQKTSSRTANDFLTGKENDLVKVMVDSQKSSLGFQAMVQVRNRMISAYQDIMNMPI